MSKQVLDIQQMQHLEELGVDTSKANFYWHRTKSLNNYNDWDEWKLHYGVLRLARGFTTINCQYVRTFTLQDILDLLPSEIECKEEPITYHIEIAFDGDGVWEISYTRNSHVLEYFYHKNFIEVAYKILCWCIVNGYVETKKP